MVSRMESLGLRCKKSGFTLIELLVVVAIISLLVSILLPSLRRARELAKLVVCSTSMRQLGTIFEMYGTESRGWLPWGKYDCDMFWKNPGAWNNDSWVHCLVNAGVLDSPNPAGNWFTRTVGIEAMFCTERSSMKRNSEVAWDYNPGHRLLGFGVPSPGYPRMTKLEEVREGDRTILLAETYLGSANYYPLFISPSGAWNSGYGWDVRHGQLANFLMLDGHVSSYRFLATVGSYPPIPNTPPPPEWCFLADWEDDVKRLFWERNHLGLPEQW